MSQSSLLVGLLAAAFILYVAAKGRLPVYTNVLWGPAPPETGSDGKSGKGGGGGFKPFGIDLGDAAKVGAKVIPYVLA